MLRKLGIADALREAGLDVIDRNDDPPVWQWRAGIGDVTASNTDAVIAYVEHTRKRVSRAIDKRTLPLVLGGDCTIEIGTLAAHRDVEHRVGLIYFDGHADLNVPGSVPEGTGEFLESLDWMGVGHMLDLEGAVTELAGIGSRRPLLTPSDVAVVGFVPEQASDFERHQIDALGIRVIDWTTIARDPERAMIELLGSWGDQFEHMLVHLDVDVLNFTETPIADTSASRDVGLTLQQATRALSILVGDPRFAGLTIAEINPIRGADDHSSRRALQAFINALATAFSSYAGERQ